MLGRVLYQMSAAYSLNNVHKHVMRTIPSWVAVASMSNLEEASMINLTHIQTLRTVIKPVHYNSHTIQLSH